MLFNKNGILKKKYFEKCIYVYVHIILIKYIYVYIREHFIYRVSYEIIIKVKVSSLLYASCSWKSQLGRPEDSALARVISAGMYSSISASSSYLYTIIEDISDSEISEIAR